MGHNLWVRRKRLLAWTVLLLLAVNAALLAVQPGLALPRSLGAYFLGPKMIRAEVIVRDRGTVIDYRLDQGRVRAVGRESITLLERDGTLVVVPVSPTAEVLLNGRQATLRSLRRGQSVVTVRESGNPADTVRATTVP